MNFLQKGLGALESRLDRVLLDEIDQPREQPPQERRERSSMEISRRSGERERVGMQERLARVVAMKAAASAAAASPSGGSRSATPVGVNDKEKEEGWEKEKEEGATLVEGKNGDSSGGRDIEKEAEVTLRDSMDSPIAASVLAASNGDIGGDAHGNSDSNGSGDKGGKGGKGETTDEISTATSTHEDLQAHISHLISDLAICEKRRQEESHASSERIDALEEKLRYLTRETATAAHTRATSSTVIPVEKKLAEKDEKIALLLEEGERLSRNELRLQTTIKKLRAKAQEEEKVAAEMKRRAEKAEKALAEEREKVKRMAEVEKRALERVKAMTRLEKEVETLKNEKDIAGIAALEAERRLKIERTRAEEAEGKAQTEALEKERKMTEELKEKVEQLRSDAAIIEERLKSEVTELKSKIEKDAQKFRTKEAELMREQSAMERQLELLRARAEEVSSGSGGDAHAKILRQVETLQTQYAIACDNWQGIESSLLVRVVSLEKERDDLAKKEGEIRRKAREMSLKSKKLETDLEAAQSKSKDVESELASQAEILESIRNRLTTAEAASQKLQDTLRTERETHEHELQSRIDEERNKWEETRQRQPPPQASSSFAPATSHPQHPYSSRNNSLAALSTTDNYFLNYRKASMPSGPGGIPPRSSSVEPPAPVPQHRTSSGYRTPPVRQESLNYSLYPYISSTNQSRTSLPDQDQLIFDPSPSSPHLKHPDLISVSTVGAGPSVQLVERMSAAVRRLESEMAGAREEISALTVQRDEARGEVAELMAEGEDVRVARGRSEELELELETVKMRLDKSLEMLGEKSERVEELQNDVLDLKEMYKELVLTTSGGGK